LPQLGDSQADVVELRSARHSGVTLGRPGGYVAYAGDSLAAVHAVLERNTT
jgi:hypothetical protein